jgi:8-oxo-dGTP pyrophosphatase MutT (NUDIX family)
MLKNVAVYFVNYRGFVLLLKNKYTNKWMTPGGNIERGESTFVAMTREFKEETSSSFPNTFTIQNEWRYKEDTKVYLVFSRSFMSEFRTTDETIDRKFFHYKDIKNIRNIRMCVKNSFEDLNICEEIDKYLMNRW